MPWAPGTSGNPSGRPRGAAGVARYVAEQTNNCQELVDRLLELSRSVDTPVRERFAATEALLSRAIGKSVSTEVTLQLGAVRSVDELLAMPPQKRLAAMEAMEVPTVHSSEVHS